jgi:hypothetical protein
VRCSFVKADKERCRGTATGGAAYCYGHDPDRAEERSRNAKKAGRAGGNGRPSGLSETAEAKRWIKGLVAQLLRGTVERDVATAAFQGINVLARYIELERKIKETEELEERLTELENAQPDNTGGYRNWAR